MPAARADWSSQDTGRCAACRISTAGTRQSGPMAHRHEPPPRVVVHTVLLPNFETIDAGKPSGASVGREGRWGEQERHMVVLGWIAELERDLRSREHETWAVAGPVHCTSTNG
jgi:hypothetical protein